MSEHLESVAVAAIAFAINAATWFWLFPVVDRWIDEKLKEEKR
jgi:hypothetical protein